MFYGTVNFLLSTLFELARILDTGFFLPFFSALAAKVENKVNYHENG